MPHIDLPIGVDGHYLKIEIPVEIIDRRCTLYLSSEWCEDPAAVSYAGTVYIPGIQVPVM
jgi:hypothetical protein